MPSLTLEPQYRKTYNAPSIRVVCLTVKWAYEPTSAGTLPYQHENWSEFIAVSEWFRAVICAQINLPPDTAWNFLYRVSGCLDYDSYSSPKERAEAQASGESRPLKDFRAPEMYE